MSDTFTQHKSFKQLIDDCNWNSNEYLSKLKNLASLLETLSNREGVYSKIQRYLPNIERLYKTCMGTGDIQSMVNDDFGPKNFEALIQALLTSLNITNAAQLRTFVKTNPELGDFVLMAECSNILLSALSLTASIIEDGASAPAASAVAYVPPAIQTFIPRYSAAAPAVEYDFNFETTPKLPKPK